MKKLLTLLAAVNFLNASNDINANSEINNQKRSLVVSPGRPLNPERGYIPDNYFTLLFRRPDFADSLAPTYADPNLMKYLGNGGTLGLKALRDRFSKTAAMLFNEQNLKSFYWVVVTRNEGVCGVVTAFPTETEGVLEVSFLLSNAMQGRRQSRYLLEAMFNYLSRNVWKATAHPENIASCKSLESAGFVYNKTEYVSDYNGPRNFYSRTSNAQHENKEVIYFTYSGRRVPLSVLLAD